MINQTTRITATGLADATVASDVYLLTIGDQDNCVKVKYLCQEGVFGNRQPSPGRLSTVRSMALLNRGLNHIFNSFIRSFKLCSIVASCIIFPIFEKGEEKSNTQNGKHSTKMKTLNQNELSILGLCLLLSRWV